jgi:hypothetical protein
VPRLFVGTPAPPSEPTVADADAVRAAFRRVSNQLPTWPTTLDDGRWMPRQELDGLLGQIDEAETSFVVLLGEPGSGKSALLARLGQACRERGYDVFALKADFLPPLLAEHDRSVEDLGERLRLPADPVTCVRGLARTNKVVVLLDQLDAVADLVDLRPAPLNMPLDLAQEVAGQTNVHVVMSCRSFEYRHDIRLQRTGAEERHLALPEWSQVSEVLAERRVESAGWPDGFREILRRIQHLKVFLRHFSGPQELQVFSSYQSMLDRLWAKEIAPDSALSSLVEELAGRMSEEESMWLPAAPYQERKGAVDRLEAVGILQHREDGKQVGFAHQTLFTHARARAFVSGQTSLAEHVLERQRGLFVRPTLWSALVYIRDAHPGAYERELSRLWGDLNLRKHIRYLLIDFMGQVSQPASGEVARIVRCLENAEHVPRILQAARGNPDWFHEIRRTCLPLLMAKPEQEAWPVTGLLGSAWSFARDDVLAALKSQWLPDKDRDGLTWAVLQELEGWDEDTVEVACTVARRSDVLSVWVMHLAKAVSGSRPELAPLVIVARLQREFAKAEAQCPVPMEPQPPGTPEIDLQMARRFHEPMKPVAKLLDDGVGDWYGLDAIANAAPKAFLDAVWPIMRVIFDRLATDEEAPFSRYRDIACLATQLRDDEDRLHEYSLLASVEAAIRALAKAQPDDFFGFADTQQDADLLVVQRLLARGYIGLAETHTQATLSFLLADERRLFLGDYTDMHKESKWLIGVLAPHLGDTDLRRIEQAVLAFQPYRDCAKPDEALAVRRDRPRADREHRLRLLRALPENRLSEEARELFRRETRALPNVRDWDSRMTGMREIPSRMSHQQMAKGSDDDIVNLFTVLHDGTGWHHPDDWMRGGSIEASREFAEFAKEDPERAIRIIRRFEAGRQEVPAGMALFALAEAGHSASDVFELVAELAGRGFSSEDFRTDAARAVGRLVGDDCRMPAAIVTLLHGWLGMPWGGPGGAVEDAEGDGDKADSGADDPAKDSILWPSGGTETIPQGTYNVLEALVREYLLRKPLAGDELLELLENHLRRPERPEVWRVLLFYLRWLGQCDRVRAEAFLVKLFDTYPAVANSRNAAQLIAHVERWVSPGTVDAWLESIRDGDWRRGPQAYGELAFFISCAQPNEDRRAVDYAEYLSPDRDASPKTAGVRLGIAHAAAQRWREPSCREAAAGALVRLVPLVDAAIAWASLGVFRTTDCLQFDACTKSLLEALCDNPDIVGMCPHSFLAERIHDLFPAHADLVAKVAAVIVDAAEKRATGGLIDTWHLGQLVDLAISLHHREETRQEGLDLFERLLDLEAHGARDALLELDARLRA